ncbi:hypothetical protein DV736_g2645, partial [Chaetothyriales sp. CBS 134916]
MGKATWDQAATDRRNYGYAMYAFWGGVVLIGILNRIYVLVMTQLNRDGTDAQKLEDGIMSRLRMWTLKHVTTPALFGYHCAHPLGYCTIPPRLQSWTIMAFLVLNVVLCSVSYHAFNNNLYHVKIFDGEYNGRIVSLNFLGRKSTATFNPDANTVSLDVPVRSWLRPKPGSYYFVYLVHGIKPWESHPFTLSSWTLPSPSEPEADSNQVMTARTTAKPKDLNLSFIVRPHHSFTGRLRNLIIANNSRDQETAATSGTGHIQSPVRVLVEGPYGSPHTHKLHRYKSVLFIIGGSGITVALAYFRALLDVLKEGQPIRLEQIKLVWAVRDAAMFLEVFGDELGAFWRQQNSEVSSAVKLQIDLYISDSAAALYPSGTSSPPEVRVEEEAKKAEAAEARAHATNGQKMAIVCCGPSRMADNTRAAVVTALTKGYEGITFYPEQFNW